MQKQIKYTFRHKIQKLILKLCHSAELPMYKNHKGPKIFTEYQKISLVILFRRSKKSLRDFIASLQELKWVQWLDLKELPSKSVLHSWLKQIPESAVRLFNKVMLKNEKPFLMAIDATGIDSWQRSRHYEKRIGNPQMPYAKLDILIDADTKLIHDHVLRIKPRHDSIGATSIFKRMRNRNVKVLGDKGYDSQALHELVYDKGNILFAPVRNWSKKVPNGHLRRKCVIMDKDYPRRNNVESVIHALKSVRVDSLKSRKHFMKKREMAWYVLVYNLEKIIKNFDLFCWYLYHLFWTRPV